MRLQVVVVVAVLGASTSQEFGTGDKKCPCLSTDSMPNKAHFGTLNGNDCLVYDYRNGTKYCYPRSYGLAKCGTHDAGLPPDCADSNGKRLLHAPEWCDDQWCYVDRNNCEAVESPLLSAYFPNANSYYSYATCGDSNVFAKHQQAANKTAPELVGVVEEYSKDLRKEAEELYELTQHDESITECMHWHSSCPCKTCGANPEWSKQLLPGGSSTEINLDFSKATLTLSDKLDDNSLAVARVKCLTQVIASKYKTVVRREYNDKNRIAYLYYGDQGTGGIVNWPALEWCTSSYDARLRPWYATAATGPKDLIILLDSSGSMASAGLWDPAVSAAKAVLRTLTDKDFATIVLYSSRANVFDDIESMHPMNGKNQEMMAQFLDDSHANGGTNFRIGFELVSKVLKNSVKEGKTTGCEIQTVLFLTDGKDTSGFAPSEIEHLGLKGTTILTYSFGDDADEKLPKQIACQNNGIWYPVRSSAPVATIMAKYYQLFAASIESDAVRWTMYQDSVTGTPLLAGCLPVYDRSGTIPELVGVSCMDINVIVSLDTLWQKPRYKEMWEAMDKVTRECPKLKYGANTLQALRQQVGERSVCRACDNTDEGCSPSPSPNPSPSGGDSSAGGNANVVASGYAVSSSIAMILSLAALGMSA